MYDLMLAVLQMVDSSQQHRSYSNSTGFPHNDSFGIFLYEFFAFARNQCILRGFRHRPAEHYRDLLRQDDICFHRNGHLHRVQ